MLHAHVFEALAAKGHVGWGVVVGYVGQAHGDAVGHVGRLAQQPAQVALRSGGAARGVGAVDVGVGVFDVDNVAVHVGQHALQVLARHGERRFEGEVPPGRA